MSDKRCDLCGGGKLFAVGFGCPACGATGHNEHVLPGYTALEIEHWTLKRDYNLLRELLVRLGRAELVLQPHKSSPEWDDTRRAALHEWNVAGGEVYDKARRLAEEERSEDIKP